MAGDAELGCLGRVGVCIVLSAQFAVGAYDGVDAFGGVETRDLDNVVASWEGKGWLVGALAVGGGS